MALQNLARFDSITQFLSRPLHLEFSYKLKEYFLYYIFIYIYKYIIYYLYRKKYTGRIKLSN